MGTSRTNLRAKQRAKVASKPRDRDLALGENARMTLGGKVHRTVGPFVQASCGTMTKGGTVDLEHFGNSNLCMKCFPLAK